MSVTMKPGVGLLAVALAVTAIGCGGKYESSVSGSVTLDGAPLPIGTVTFAPVGEGTIAHGRIDEGGDYALRTGREEGLKAGDYRVTVVAREKPASDYGPNGGPPPPGRQLTPDWYRSADSSGLEFSVERGGNTIDLALTSEPPAGWSPDRRRKRR